MKIQMRNQFVTAWMVLLVAGVRAYSAHGSHFKYSHTTFIHQQGALRTLLCSRINNCLRLSLKYPYALHITDIRNLGYSISFRTTFRVETNVLLDEEIQLSELNHELDIVEVKLTDKAYNFINIFEYSHFVKEHKEHLYKVFIPLRSNHLFLIKSKIDLYSDRMDYLGHIINNKCIHANIDKM